MGIRANILRMTTFGEQPLARGLLARQKLVIATAFWDCENPERGANSFGMTGFE